MIGSVHNDSWKCWSPRQPGFGQADNDTRRGPSADSWRELQASRAERVGSPARGRGGDLSLERRTPRVDRTESPGRVAAGDLSLEAPKLRPERPSARACAVFQTRAAGTPRAEHSLTTPATPHSAEVLRDYSSFEVARLRPRRPASAGKPKHDSKSPLVASISAQGSRRRVGPTPAFSKGGLPISAAARWAMTPEDASVRRDGDGVLAERDALAAENAVLRRMLQGEAEVLRPSRPLTPSRPRVARASSAQPQQGNGRRCDANPARQHRRGFR